MKCVHKFKSVRAEKAKEKSKEIPFEIDADLRIRIDVSPARLILLIFSSATPLTLKIKKNSVHQTISSLPFMLICFGSVAGWFEIIDIRRRQLRFF